MNFQKWELFSGSPGISRTNTNYVILCDAITVVFDDFTGGKFWLFAPYSLIAGIGPEFSKTIGELVL